jgi:hypothetical protein
MHCELSSQLVSSPVLIPLEGFEAKPTPVHAMMLNQSVLDLHDLDKIHLFAGECLVRVLPHQRVAVGEIAGSESASGGRRTPEHDLDEVAQLAPAANNSDIALQQISIVTSGAYSATAASTFFAPSASSHSR